MDIISVEDLALLEKVQMNDHSQSKLWDGLGVNEGIRVPCYSNTRERTNMINLWRSRIDEQHTKTGSKYVIVTFSSMIVIKRIE